MISLLSQEGRRFDPAGGRTGSTLGIHTRTQTRTMIAST